MAYFSEQAYERVRVTAITKDGADVVTQYDSTLTIPWTNGIPTDVPNIGDIWMVEKYAASRWRFVVKMGGTDFSVMHYAMSLDARTCMGKERAIVDDLYNFGVDEVYLNVADNGIVYWDSDAAPLYGLTTDGDHVSQLMDRFADYGIAVTFTIGSSLWSDTGNATHNMYQQVYFTDATTKKYSGRFSVLPAAAPLRALVDELYLSYGSSANGVCIRDFGLIDEHADFNFAVQDGYYRKYGVMPDYGITNYTGDSTWWIEHFQWTDYLDGLTKNFFSTVAADIGNWSLGVALDSRVICQNKSEQKAGRLSTGIPDDISGYGMARLGIPLEYTQQTDDAAELRSLEWQIAELQRYAKDSQPLYMVNLDTVTQYDGTFELLSKYDAGTVLMDDYEHWRLLSDEQVIALKQAMDKYSVTDKSTLDYVGFVLSNDSRDMSYYAYNENYEYSLAAENMASKILDKTPHRLKVFFDDDLEGTITGVSSLVVFMANNLTDAAVDNLTAMITEGAQNVVLLGRCGQFCGASTAERDEYPFLSLMGQTSYGTQEYVDSIRLASGAVDIADGVYILTANDVGMNLSLDAGSSTSYINVIEGGVETLQKVKAPILFDGRSSMLGIDILRDNVLVEIASELVLYAIGREN